MNKKDKQDLYQAILSLKTTEEVGKFLRDIATLKEIEDLSERWQIALLLNQGITYREISKKLNVSTTTVGRVATWLNSGMGGYQIALDRLNHHRTSSSKER